MDTNKKSLLIKQLQSSDANLVKETIQQLRFEGNNEMLLPLANLYANSQNNEIKQELYSLFSDLKNQASAEYIISFLKLKELESIKEPLLSTCWQSRIDYSAFLEYFIDLVCHEPFSIAFEAFTVIENLESKVTVERKNELLAYIKSVIKSSDAKNKVLVDDLISIIEQYDE